MTSGVFAFGPSVLRLEVASGAAAVALLRRLAPFATRAEPEGELHVALAGPALGQELQPGDQVPLPALHHGADGSLVIAGRGCRALLSEDRSRVDIEGADDDTALDGVLRVLLADRVMRSGGLLVHGVALVHSGHAALFTGQSGAGKSTLGGLWRQAGGALLADELVAVLPGPVGPVAWGTPWNVGTPRHAPLRLLGTLSWGNAHTLHPLSAADAARTLLGNVLLADRSPASKAEAFRRVAALLSRVRSVRLAFARDTGVAAVLRPALEPASD